MGLNFRTVHSYRQGVAMVLRVAMGLLFFASAIGKTAGFSSARGALAALGFDFIPWLAGALTATTIAVEAVLALCLLVNRNARPAYAGVIVMGAIFLAAGLPHLPEISGIKAVDCGCFGGLIESRTDWWFILRSCCLIAAAAWLHAHPSPESAVASPSVNPHRLQLADPSESTIPSPTEELV